jgi:peptide chain release factor 2
MDELSHRLQSLETAFQTAADQLGLSAQTAELEQLKEQTERPNFWENNLAAQGVMKRFASLSARINPWLKLRQDIKDLKELAATNDKSLVADLQHQVGEFEQQLQTLKADLKFAGAYDDHDAIVTLSAGAGGTDAQDWTQILLRMYSRWAENNGYKITLIDEAPGEEAGLKRAIFEITGDYAYGHLKGENGVHRLVRLSPFNADNLRQTSFAKAEVMPKVDRPEDLELDPKELKIDVYRSGGHGGQSVNTTDSAVRVTHMPTGLTVAIQNERSQLQNKETALTILRSRLAQLQLEQHQEKLSELKGPNQSAEWGNQIRSYVLHPYKQVKDLRTRYETTDADGVLDGKLNPFIDAYLEFTLGDS